MAGWKSYIVGVMLFVAIVAGAFAVMQIADASQDQAATGDGVTVENETYVQQVGIYQLTQNSTNEFTARFDKNVTVYNNSSALLIEGNDYEWNESDGAIKFLSSPNTTDGEQANITYTYYSNTQGVRDIAGPLGVVIKALRLLPTMAAGLVLVVFFLAMSALIIRQMGNVQTRR
jgi:hypothetical protein